MNNCRICCSSSFRSEMEVEELRMGIGGRFRYRACADCGCLQIETIPEDLARFYPQGYYSYQPMRDLLWETGRISRWKYRHREQYRLTGSGWLGRLLYWCRSAHVNRYMPFSYYSWLDYLRTDPDFRVSVSDAILDIGCGAGAWLRYMDRAGFTNLTGADPFNEEDIFVDNHLSIYKKSMDEVSGLFRMVLLSHSLEHMPDQLQALKDVARLMQPDGFAVISIPMHSEYFVSQFGPFWYALDPPRHLYLHTEKSFQIIARQAGLEIRRTIFDSGTFNIVASRIYRDNPDLKVRNELLKDGSLIERMSKDSELGCLIRQLNRSQQSDYATFLLKKL